MSELDASQAYVLREMSKGSEWDRHNWPTWLERCPARELAGMGLATEVEENRYDSFFRITPAGKRVLEQYYVPPITQP